MSHLLGLFLILILFIYETNFTFAWFVFNTLLYMKPISKWLGLFLILILSYMRPMAHLLALF